MLTRSIIIGLTGQTGAGKTTISRVMQKLGCSIIDADKVARGVVGSEECKKKLIGEFGSDIYSNGELNRRLLAKKAFSNKKSTQRLNEITHPYILKEIKNYINELAYSGKDIIVVDAPLLFESGMDSLCDKVVVVVSPVEVRANRIIKRDNISRQEAELRINAQNNQEYYTKRADYIIDGTNVNDKEIAILIGELVEAVNVNKK